MSTSTQHSAVSRGIRISYALPAFALAVVGIPIYVYVPKFYSDVVGVHIGLLGVIILATRIFDAVSDPVLGYISDRTRTRFGRRRPYIAVGSLLLAFSLFWLFNPFAGSRDFETTWFTVWFFLVFLFWTAVTVPYEALGPELTFDYKERIALFGIRDGALIAGTLLAASSPVLIVTLFGLDDSDQGEKQKFFWISVFYIPMVVAFCWWCVLKIRERDTAVALPAHNILSGIRQVTSNRPFIILLISYTIAAFGSNLPATLILYYVEYVLHSARADLFLFIYFAVGILLLPAWVLLAGKIGKKAAWITAMLINTGSFTGVFFLGPGDEMLYGILVVFSGIGFGATVAIPSAMQADVIDYDQLLTGKRQEGQYIGIWSIAKKLAAAVGVGIALSVLGASGYEPNVQQTDQIQLTLKVLYALVPSLCNIAALGIALLYPISSIKHSKILEAVETRKKGLPVMDPLTGKTLESP